MNIKELSSDTTTVISSKSLWALCCEAQIYHSMVKQLCDLREKEKEFPELESRADRVFAKAEKDSETLKFILQTIIEIPDTWLTDDDFANRVISIIDRLYTTDIKKEDLDASGTEKQTFHPDE